MSGLKPAPVDGAVGILRMLSPTVRMMVTTIMMVTMIHYFLTCTGHIGMRLEP